MTTTGRERAAASAALIMAMAGALAGPARAEPPDDDDEVVEPAPAAAEAPADRPGPAGAPLLLGKGKIVIAGSTLSVNVSAGAGGEPVALAPAVWYGLRERVTVGLTHDGGTTPWTPRPAILTIPSVDLMGNPDAYVGGGGICIGSDEGGCLDPYGHVGLEALLAIKRGKLDVIGHPALDIATFSPFALRLRIGALGRYSVSRKLSIVADPRLEVGLTERSSNKEAIDLPAWAWYAVTARFAAYAHTGLAAPFDGFTNYFRVPLQVGASLAITRKVTAGVDFAFTNLIGRAGGLDGRALGLRVAYALDRTWPRPRAGATDDR